MSLYKPNQVLSYIEDTDGIVVTVIPKFYHEGSNSNKNIFIWLYKVKIENTSKNTIQILSRNWQIFDVLGAIETIEGPGVIGHQPIIKAGDNFEYTSQVRLFSSSGLMLGKYTALNLDTKKELIIHIPTFSLETKLIPKYVN